MDRAVRPSSRTRTAIASFFSKGPNRPLFTQSGDALIVVLCPLSTCFRTRIPPFGVWDTPKGQGYFMLTTLQ